MARALADQLTVIDTSAFAFSSRSAGGAGITHDPVIPDDRIRSCAAQAADATESTSTRTALTPPRLRNEDSSMRTPGERPDAGEVVHWQGYCSPDEGCQAGEIGGIYP